MPPMHTPSEGSPDGDWGVTVSIKIPARIERELANLRSELGDCKKRLDAYDAAWAKVGDVVGDSSIQFS